MHGLGFPAYQVSVDIFFAISGYLVAGSLLSRRALLPFAVARFRRIVPGLSVSVVATVAVVGLFYTTLPLIEFLSHRETLGYLGRNVVPLLRAQLELPGAFEGNPHKHLVNPSLWTLSWEVRMYITLGLIWWIARRPERDRFVPWLVAAWAGFLVLATVSRFWPWTDRQVLLLEFRFAPVFLGGAILQLLASRHRPKGWIAACLALSWLVVLWNKSVFFPLYLVTLPYVVTWLALAPSGVLLNFNRLGDYSYGIYIYSFPLQQILASLLPGVGVVAMIGLSAAGATILGWLSWSLVEKPLLDPKHKLAANTAGSPR